MNTVKSITDIYDLTCINSICGLALINKAGQILSANPVFFKLFNSPADSHSLSLSDLAIQVDPAAENHLQQTLVDRRTGIVKLVSETDNKVLHIHLAALTQAYRLVVVENLPQNKSLTCEISSPTKDHNSILQLKNRHMLNEIIANWKPDNLETASLAVFMIGVDRFKQVNETLSHEVGDQLLKFVAQRLLRISRSNDVVAHFEGDKFIILQIGQNQPINVTAMAERLIDLLKRPFLISGQQVNISASIGLAALYHGTGSASDLIRHAELALYEAKVNGRGNYCFFEQFLEKKALEQRELEVSLRRALLLQEFKLFYQPQISMLDRRIVGFEALIRWEKLGKGLISPLSFIPLAEDTGEINDIGKWVLQTACKEAMTWPEHIKVAVNVSPVQFESDNLVQIVRTALLASGLNPERLELEVTEGLLIKNIEKALEQLWAIQAMGVSVAMDDFGTGFSSLNYLNSFPFSKIKIDQSFVRQMQTDKSRTLIKAIISLGTALGMKTLAEGVETEEQFEFLAFNGCVEAQGYLISKPVPTEAIQKLIT